MNDLLLVYGKIIVDSIQVRNTDTRSSSLGGGGPQACFGMRLWHSPVGFLTRSGIDLEPELVATLRSLDLDLRGWQQFTDLPTPRGLVQYDEQERMIESGLITSRADWFRLLDRPILLGEEQRQAAGIHLVTEFGDEPMAQTAIAMHQHGAIFSLEPIFHPHSCSAPRKLLDLARQAEIVTPDWPDASRIAGSDDFATVFRFWAGLGPEVVAIRHGVRGSYIWQRSQQQAWHIPILPVNVADPTGAGNAYGGGLCAGWYHTHDARIAACHATVAAALMIGSVGMPVLDDTIRTRAAELLQLALAQTVPMDGL